MVRKAVLGIISWYQKYISPNFAPSCRYLPTCSDYMAEAISLNGVSRGMFMGVKRILRCHPFASGGYDPVKRPIK